MKTENGLKWAIPFLLCFLTMAAACGGDGDSYDPGETTSARCLDGSDNDGDGDTDCDDSDCAGFVFCAPATENTASDCDDGQDNDGDGDTDCDDADCQGFVFCAGAGSELDSVTCQDGVDNDEDGQTDCDDLGCEGFTFCGGAGGETTAEACQDGDDNDQDDAIDCDDSDCQGYTFCLPGMENTPTACDDGQDNDEDGMTDCVDPSCQGFTFCDADAGEGSQGACADGLDNDRDGLFDCADDGCWVWAFCGHYQGFPVVDVWGETFDGLERPAKTWAEAVATCESLGGRLPTATELWRNNATDGTGNLSDDTVGNFLWTNIRSYHVNPTRVAVALSDGYMTYFDETHQAKFRCIWPDEEGVGFDQARCHGPVGSACWSHARVWNVDVQDRIALDYTSASNECAFYGGSLPSAMEWAEMIHAGIEQDEATWFWAADVISKIGNIFPVSVRMDVNNRASWYPGGGWVTDSDHTGRQSFRCIGLARPASFPEANPTCADGCLSFSARRSSLVSDAVDRVALGLAAAVEDCRAVGGELPQVIEAAELLHEGWSFLGGGSRWTSSLVWVPFLSPVPYSLVFAPQGDGGAWYPSGGLVAGIDPLTEQLYRCVWRAPGLEVPVCQANQVVQWNGAVYFCNSSLDGSSSGNANGVEIVDDWGNAWDGLERLPATFDSARQTCEDLGGRLPYASEIWAVRNRPDPGDGSDPLFNPHSFIGNTTDTNLLWTLSTTASSANRALVQVSGGGSGQDAEGASHNFRCIWASSRGEVLGEGNCYGPPDAACHRSDGMIADSYDRVALDVAGAIEECRHVGGGLPDFRQAMQLIHAGWPNGTGQYNRLADVWYDDFITGWRTSALNYWSGVGQSTWVQGPIPDFYQSTDFLHFRCIHDTRLR